MKDGSSRQPLGTLDLQLGVPRIMFPFCSVLGIGFCLRRFGCGLRPDFRDYFDRRAKIRATRRKYLTMARSDLLVSLVRAAAGGDRETLKSTTEALAADERAKITISSRSPSAGTFHGACDAPRPHDLCRHRFSKRPRGNYRGRTRTNLNDLILPLPVRENGRQLVEEARSEGRSTSEWLRA